MDFEVRKKYLLEEDILCWNLSSFWHELLSECKREFCVLKKEIDKLEFLAFEHVENSELITEIYYYQQRLQRDRDELDELIRCIEMRTIEQIQHILRKK